MFEISNALKNYLSNKQHYKGSKMWGIYIFYNKKEYWNLILNKENIENIWEKYKFYSFKKNNCVSYYPIGNYTSEPTFYNFTISTDTLYFRINFNGFIK